jgi:hypothetical protein
MLFVGTMYDFVDGRRRLIGQDSCFEVEEASSFGKLFPVCMPLRSAHRLHSRLRKCGSPVFLPPHVGGLKEPPTEIRI